MRIQILDVEHGGCSLLTADSGARIMIDAGHNVTTNWRPHAHLHSAAVRHLDQLIVTNYDEVHASDLANVLRVVCVGTLSSNPRVSAADLRQLKHKGGLGKGIAALADLKDRYTARVTRAGPLSREPEPAVFLEQVPAGVRR